MENPSTLKIWIVAFIEGFSTLAVEVIAIRLATPVVGSSMTLTGVMLGVVLFALSAGYWRGGELSARWSSDQTRSALMRNLLLAGVIYAAISFPAEAPLLERALDAGFGLAPAIGVSAAVLFVLPVYLASQTVPMLAELTNTEGKAGKASGKVLFFSTLGSVAGGILTPLGLFPSLGVRASTYVVCGSLAAAAGIMAAGRAKPSKIALAAAFAVAALLLCHWMYRDPADLFSFDSAHQSIRIRQRTMGDGRVERVMILNGGYASGVYAATGETAFLYVREAAKALAALRCESVLAVGSAGFTFPRDAAALPFVNLVDAVDVDPAVFEIAQRRFLLQTLSSKIHFYPVSARYALRQFRRQGKSHGFVLLDAYSGKGIPEELVTVEFFSDVRATSQHVAANLILDRDLESDYARNALASFRQVFGNTWILDVAPGPSSLTNFLVTNWGTPGASPWEGTGRIYTDNRNTADRDHVNLLWGGE